MNVEIQEKKERDHAAEVDQGEITKGNRIYSRVYDRRRSRSP